MFTYNQLTTEEEILEHAKKLEGLSIREIGPEYEVSKWLNNSSNKGAIGNAIQEVYFGIPANSSKLSDFEHHSIELKVTPIKMNKDKSLSAKERLVLNIINYMEDYKQPFETSSLIKKSNNILIIFYLYDGDIQSNEFKILKSTRFAIPEEDLPTIKEDFNIIITKIMNGQAHLISESDTTYLSACTKGAGKGKDLRQQPFSQTLATQRAFSFKAGYITSFFNSISKEKINKLIIPKEISLNDYIKRTLQPYINLTTDQIEHKLNYYPKLKQTGDKGYLSHLTSKLIQRIFNLEDVNLDDTEQFRKAQLKLKTVRFRHEKSKNQDMSWPNLNFFEILDVPFQDSTWYEWFVETKYLFIYFKDVEDFTTLVGYKIWRAPDEMVNELELLYNHIKQMLRDNILTAYEQTTKSGQIIWKNNLPKKNEFKYFQIRPKGTKEHSFTLLPNGNQFKKQCLFVNKEYIHSLFI